MARRALSAIVFTTGFAVTAVELAAVRIAAPFVGNSLFVWGSSIGVVLLALALGYHLGGSMVDRSPSRRLLGTIILIAGIWLAAAGVAFAPLARFLIDLLGNLPFGLLFITQLLMLIGFGLPLTLLGMVSPFAIRLATTDLTQAGRTAGHLFAVSTAGSLLGIWLTSFVLVPTLGVRATFLLTALLLIVDALAIIGRRASIGLIFLAAAVPVIGQPLKAIEGTVAIDESPYQYVQVIDRGDRRYLITDEGLGAQSVAYAGEAWSESYYDLLTVLPRLRSGTPNPELLMLGLGAGTLARQARTFLGEDAALTGVEIDPSVIALARQYFDLDRLGVDVHVDEARSWLTRHHGPWDVIAVDVFTKQLSVPAEFTTLEFFQLVRDRLRVGGLLEMNVVTFVEDRTVQQLFQTVRAVFPSTYRIGSESRTGNTIIVASDAPIDFAQAANFADAGVPARVLSDLGSAVPVEPTTGPALLTDDRNPLDVSAALNALTFRVQPSYL